MPNANLPVIKPLHRRVAEYYLLLKCSPQRTANALDLDVSAIRKILARPEVKAYLNQRQDDLASAVTARTMDVIATLNRQMMADIADLMPEEPILQAAKKNGLSRNIKKIKVTEHISKKGGMTRHIELEMYSAQEAAKALARIFGLDSQDDLQQARNAIKLYCEMKSCEPEIAIVALAPHMPSVMKVRDEFLHQRRLEAGSAIVEGDILENGSAESFGANSGAEEGDKVAPGDGRPAQS